MPKTLAHMSTFTAEINVSKPPNEESSSVHHLVGCSTFYNQDFRISLRSESHKSTPLGSKWLTFLPRINQQMILPNHCPDRFLYLRSKIDVADGSTMLRGHVKDPKTDQVKLNKSQYICFISFRYNCLNLNL